MHTLLAKWLRTDERVVKAVHEIFKRYTDAYDATDDINSCAGFLLPSPDQHDEETVVDDTDAANEAEASVSVAGGAAASASASAAAAEQPAPQRAQQPASLRAQQPAPLRAQLLLLTAARMIDNLQAVNDCTVTSVGPPTVTASRWFARG